MQIYNLNEQFDNNTEQVANHQFLDWDQSHLSTRMYLRNVHSQVGQAIY